MYDDVVVVGMYWGGYSGIRGVDVGGKRVIGMSIGWFCWSELIVDAGSVSWSDRWDVLSVDKRFDWKNRRIRRRKKEISIFKLRLCYL